MDSDVAQPVGDAAADVWLTLQEASTRLGVSPSTLRRWADSGEIPTHRTAGGHRRFDPAAVAARAARQSPTGIAPAGGSAKLVPPVPAHQPWHTHLTHSPEAAQMRELGQRLLGLLIQYLVWTGSDTRFLADGHAVGQRYGGLAREAGITLGETVQAFLYFRSTFWRMALQIPAVAQATDAHEIMRITERIDHFMDGVLLSTIAGYEQAPVEEA